MCTTWHWLFGFHTAQWDHHLIKFDGIWTQKMAAVTFSSRPPLVCSTVVKKCGYEHAPHGQHSELIRAQSAWPFLFPCPFPCVFLSIHTPTNAFRISNIRTPDGELVTCLQTKCFMVRHHQCSFDCCFCQLFWSCSCQWIPRMKMLSQTNDHCTWKNLFLFTEVKFGNWIFPNVSKFNQLVPGKQKWLVDCSGCSCFCCDRHMSNLSQTSFQHGNPNFQVARLWCTSRTTAHSRHCVTATKTVVKIWTFLHAIEWQDHHC